MRRLFTAALAVGLSVYAVPAHAQLGKLKSAITKKVAPAPSGAVRTGNVSFDGRVLEITEPNMQKFLTGLAAESEEMKRIDGVDVAALRKRNEAKEKEYDRATKAYEKKLEDFERCGQPFLKESEQKMGAHQRAAEADTAAIQRVVQRVAAAHQRNDMAEVRRLTDSLQRATMPTSMATVNDANDIDARARATCGDRPVAPERPALEEEPGYAAAREAGVKASGFTEAQYAIMRERIVPFVVSNGKSSGGMMFTDGEVDVINSHLSDLVPYREMLQSS